MTRIGRILIVGGGVAGLTLAVALHKKGYIPELVERNPSGSAIGAGINIPANGVRVLKTLGLLESVSRSAAILRSWAFFDVQGNPLTETNLEDLWKDVGPCLGIARPKLHEALREAADEVPLRLGVSLSALSQDRSQVRVGFSDGTSGEYDLVVGADGIHSTVRRLVLDPSPPVYTGSMVWRSIIPTRPSGVADRIVTLAGEGCTFGVVPLGGGESYGWGTVDQDRTEDPIEGRLERFRHRFAEFRGPVPTYLAALQSDQQLHVGPIDWVEPKDWHRGRVVLIGDAAHAGPPSMGEGGCMAMEDSIVLAEVLSTAETVEEALEGYVRRRRPRADWVQDQSRAVMRAMALPSAVRNAALRERGDQMFRNRYQPLIPVP